ncbi:low voltage-gated calcium channel [Aureococcus anophagefferens]|nr:low voltage-gated calcium channel [Aureococcus anophagefferens]
MDAHLATTLRTAETLLLSPPVQVVPDAVLRDSWRVADEPAAARLAEAVAEVLGELRDSGESGAALVRASGGESSSESESSASEDEPDAPLDAGDALDASISSDDSDDETAGAARPAAAAARLDRVARPVNLAPTQGGAAAHRRSTLEAVAAATGGPEGAVFVERFAALGGLAALLDTLQHAAPDEASQAAAGAIADGGGCHLLVSALFGLAGDDGDVRAAHAAGAWALGALAPLDGLREDGATVAARFPKSPAARNAALARTQLQAAFDRADGDARRDGAAAPEDPRGCVVT